MEERMMKKYFCNIFALAALLMAGAAFTACSSDDNIEQPANPAGEKTYTLTINASKGANASTRALALDGVKLVAKWADGDVLSVFKANSRTGCTAGNLLGTISPVAGSISADGDQATFTGTLSGTVSDGDKLMLVYHYNAFAIAGFEGQAGTLASASNLDCATALVTASVSGSDITISETSATFTTHTAMLKLTLTTDGTTTINPTSLKMSMSAGPLTLKEFTFTPTDATYTANGNGVLYFALPSVDDVIAGLALESKIVTKEQLAAATITYTATVGSDTYTATKTGYTFAAGTYYAGTLTMAKPAAAYTMAANATAGDVGKLICTDGHIHAYNADAACTKSRVAMIAYVGNDAETSSTNTAFKNGLALALEDVSDTKTWCSQESVTCLGTQYDYSTKFNDLAGIANTDALVNHTGHTHAAANAARGYNSGTHPTGTSAWFLPSAGQWSKMATAAGSYANLKTNAGLLAGARYWSSTESSANAAWRFNSNNGAWSAAAKDLDGPLVRACLAF